MFFCSEWTHKARFYTLYECRSSLSNNLVWSLLLLLLLLILICNLKKETAVALWFSFFNSSYFGSISSWSWSNTNTSLIANKLSINRSMFPHLYRVLHLFLQIFWTKTRTCAGTNLHTHRHTRGYIETWEGSVTLSEIHMCI